MPRNKEISEDLRSRVVDLHKAGKGYRAISKSLDIHQSTVRQIVYKWKLFGTVATLPRSGRPAKMTLKAHRRILSEVKKNPGVTAKSLKESLKRVNICVHESTIHKTLNSYGFQVKRPQRKALRCKKNFVVRLKFAKEPGPSSTSAETQPDATVS